MKMFELQVRPIDQWPKAFTRDRKRSPFNVGYGTMMTALERELKHMKAKSAVMLMALDEKDIRIDGRPRAGATPRHPGVILVVQTEDRGTLRFPCDTYEHWQVNLRAIGLTLEALRRIDRYGVTTSGEQYTGWKALPPPNGDHWTKEQAAEFITRFLGISTIIAPFEYREAIRRAELKSHPDRGGNASDFNKVQQARKLLLGK